MSYINTNYNKARSLLINNKSLGLRIKCVKSNSERNIISNSLACINRILN